MHPPTSAESDIDLLFGDCFHELAQLPDGYCDALITDPPYGITNLAFDTARIDWNAWLEQVHRVCTPQAVLICFAAQPFATDLIVSNRAHFRYDLIWHKPNATGFLSANRRPMRSHEHILIFCRRPGQPNTEAGASVYNPQFEAGTPYHHSARKQMPLHYGTAVKDRSYSNNGRRYPRSVVTFGRDVRIVHPTQKPLKLMRWLVRTYTLVGQRILDPFMGSGTTAEACLEEGRRFIGMEIDAAYFQQAQDRLAEAEARLHTVKAP